MKALDEVAAKEGRSRSELIRDAIRKTWLKGLRPRQSATRPAAARASAIASPEARAAWRQRFGNLLTELEKSAVTDMSEEELTAFVRTEIQARRQERREADEPHAGGH
jgi:metal-responsive CopG/Arc/MetJ family transcriptional regulator